MALRMFDGFNYDPEGRWILSSTFMDHSSSYGRNGTGGMRFFPSSNATALMKHNLESAIPENATMVVGMAIKRIDFDNTHSLFKCASGGSVVWEVRSNSGGIAGDRHLCVYVGGVEYGSFSVSSSSFEYYEFVVDMDDSVGSVTIFKDGIQIHQTTGIDTKDATGAIDEVMMSTHYRAMEYYLDDFYVLDDQGSGLTSRLGDVHVKTLAPSGQGNYSAGVGSDGNSVDNYLLVDDVATGNPDESDYVDLGSVSDRDSYTIANLGSGEVPVAVKVVGYMGGGNGINTSAEGFLRISSTDYDSSSSTVSSSYKLKDFTWETNPNTAVAWAEDDLDGVEIGIQRA